MDLEQVKALLAQFPPDQRAVMLNRVNRGLDRSLGIEFTHVDAEKVVAKLSTSAEHVQPYGLIHGGVYCALVETACSVGAALSVLDEGRNAVGVENRTAFLRACRQGAVLTVTATPLAGQEPGRKVWEAIVTDEENRRCATGQVHIAVLDAERRIDGQSLNFEL